MSSEWNRMESYNADKRFLLCQLSSSDGTLRQPIKENESSLSYGHPGDQLGIESNSKQYSNGMGSGGFGNVYRFHDETIRHKIADYELRMVSNGMVGYSQLVNAGLWRWRGGYMRAMCAKQQGLDMQAWGRENFAKNWTTTWKNNRLNMRWIKLNELDPSMADVPCNADCSSSVLSNIQCVINLWFHCAYRYNGTYVRWMDAVPSSVYGMKGGGQQQSKFFRKCLVAAEETDVDYDSLGYNFNTEAKCDWISYEDYDVLDCPYYDLTDDQKSSTFEWGTNSNIYNDPLYTEKDPYDESITGWAPPTYGGRNVRVWHIGFNPANPTRNVNYRYRCNSHWQKGYSSVALKDKNGNKIRWNLYVYGYGYEAPTKDWLRKDISETEAKEQQMYDLMRTAGSYKWNYTPTMSHLVAAQDGEELLEAVYENGEFVAYEKMNGGRPWVSAVKVQKWCRAEPDVYKLQTGDYEVVHNEPYIYRYTNIDAVNWAETKGLTTVKGVAPAEAPLASALRFYGANNWNMWNDRSKWFDKVSDWRSSMETYDTSLTYYQNESWSELAGATYGWFDVYNGSTDVRTNWTSKNRLNKRFTKKVKHIMVYKTAGNYTETTIPAGATKPTSNHQIFYGNVGTDVDPIWTYYMADGSSSTSALQFNYVWVHTADMSTWNPDDDLFPYFTVVPCLATYDSAIDNYTFTYNGTTYQVPRGNSIAYYINIHSSGMWYTQWDRWLDGGGRQFFVETTKNFEIEWSEQFQAEGSEENPETEDFYFWLMLDGTPEDGVWIEVPSPFSDQETDEEDEQLEEVAVGSVAPVIEYDTYLWAGDWIVTRTGSQGLLQGGHVVSYG